MTISFIGITERIGAHLYTVVWPVVEFPVLYICVLGRVCERDSGLVLHGDFFLAREDYGENVRQFSSRLRYFVLFVLF